MHMELYTRTTSMEPLFPMDQVGALKEIAFDLFRKSAQLGGVLHPITRESVVELLRKMNSYYSNLIEGHNTHPVDIEKALQKDYSADPHKHALQIESQAHIEVQRLMEQRLRDDETLKICSPEFICWLHEEFYARMPEEFRRVKTRSGGEDWVKPGQLRECEVGVGRHIAPTFTALPQFMERFAQRYEPTNLEPVQRILGAAASHHRLAWIHPFLDGNGRVVRLFTNAYFIRVKMEGHGLWMASRGLARYSADYLAALASADLPRQGDLDGRGNLSDKGLTHFCRFFLSIAIDQVEFMTRLLDLDAMHERILAFADLLISRKKAPKEISYLLPDVFLRGEVTRGEAGRILQMPERTARRHVGQLVADGVLVSNGPSAPVRLGFPASYVGYYFPHLYPAGVELGKL
jgi:Fic family protein